MSTRNQFGLSALEVEMELSNEMRGLEALGGGRAEEIKRGIARAIAKNNEKLLFDLQEAGLLKA